MLKNGTSLGSGVVGHAHVGMVQHVSPRLYHTTGKKLNQSAMDMVIGLVILQDCYLSDFLIIPVHV